MDRYRQIDRKIERSTTLLIKDDHTDNFLV